MELEQLIEKTLASGEVITLAKDGKGYTVNCWDKDGNNRWNRYFTKKEDAQAEYDRWN